MPCWTIVLKSNYKVLWCVSACKSKTSYMHRPSIIIIALCCTVHLYSDSNTIEWIIMYFGHCLIAVLIYCILLYCILLFCTVLYYSILYCIPCLYCTELYCIYILYSIVYCIYCTALYIGVIHLILLYCVTPCVIRDILFF